MRFDIDANGASHHTSRICNGAKSRANERGKQEEEKLGVSRRLGHFLFRHCLRCPVARLPRCTPDVLPRPDDRKEKYSEHVDAQCVKVPPPSATVQLPARVRSVWPAGAVMRKPGQDLRLTGHRRRGSGYLAVEHVLLRSSTYLGPVNIPPTLSASSILAGATFLPVALALVRPTPNMSKQTAYPVLRTWFQESYLQKKESPLLDRSLFSGSRR